MKACARYAAAYPQHEVAWKHTLCPVDFSDTAGNWASLCGRTGPVLSVPPPHPERGDILPKPEGWGRRREPRDHGEWRLIKMRDVPGTQTTDGLVAPASEARRRAAETLVCTGPRSFVIRNETLTSAPPG